mgnify:CR=1 FL=1
MPKVSIVVPVYKVDNTFLRECIDSILAQSFESFELILVIYLDNVHLYVVHTENLEAAEEFKKELISIQNEYWYEVGRKVRREKEIKARKLIKCPVCGKKFKPINRRMYCSDECLRKARYEKVKAERPVKTYTKICPICGKEFTTHTDAQSYCSAKCRIRRNNNILNEKNKVPRTTKACEHCGKLFVGTPREHYCSAKCRIQHNSDKRRERTITLNNIK